MIAAHPSASGPSAAQSATRQCGPQAWRADPGAEQQHAALRRFLASTQHDPSDFKLQLKSGSWLTGMLGSDNRFLAVRRLSSRRERIYSANAHSPWLAELMNDLDQGAFDR